MIWVIVGVIILARVLCLRLGVVAGMLGLWLVLLWLETAVKTGPQIAGALTVVSLIGIMVYVDRPWKHGRR